MSSVTHPDTHESAQRRERAAIAAQACQTCRTRKSKCDEARPKCGLCQRLDVECEYREPLPTKKDKTMVHILDTLTRLETKFDNIAITQNNGLSEIKAGRTPVSSAPPYPSATQGLQEDMPQKSEFLHGEQGPYQHLTVPHKITLWPAIYIHLINSRVAAADDLQYVLQEGTPWFIKRELQKHPTPLCSDVGLPCFSITTGQAEPVRTGSVAFPTLSIQQIQEYSDAYFNTFNVLYPLLNRDGFMNGIVARLLREGYGDDDAGSVLALLVFALGQVAVEGVFDRPISVMSGQPSGFRGGTIDQPPGLPLFNEARRRLGFIGTQCTLENVQILLLQATYYGSTARHLDFWRSTVSASMGCQILIRCHAIDWTTPHGDLVKRAYWTCVLSEDMYHLDLDLPRTGIHAFEDEVPLPYFQDVQDPASAIGSPMSARTPTNFGFQESSHFQYHFLAMIALRRLITRIHDVIHECEHAMQTEPLWGVQKPSGGDGGGSTYQRHAGAGGERNMQGRFNSTASSLPVELPAGFGGPPVAVIHEMVRQLDSWRALLPRPLQWNDSDRLEFPHADPTNRRPNEPLFTADQGPIPIGHKYNLDVITAQLRTRFYYARFMMYRPFIYKALHFPELMTHEDNNCCALAIKSVCLWPLAMAPPKNKKRLVSHLFAWTQNFMGILLILKMCSVNGHLRRIVDEGRVVGRREVDQTIALMLEWVRDVKQMDGIAEWSWSILAPLYNVRPD
ncbi:hypothetical protein BAUCODRAFT_384024 [Baudoinia panamericana UAMH 10762]|uniref:Zn(2)-C6 fungal-type domain-containing protein n=1 Tax=Baudoinia panamericana (strain UAMH 10762) TaxID=717646 RepID=M2MQ42_BAUPA|nr:uncharacterized protein BAUCODRAFT_384024 [Baudoinia panamericana UAMH 10762]EMC98891.1 hypothetical protein BAUCODRAFT_384024 [Baudoinia panamericana UAMH 10762]